mmetsp:Transcript_5758/g.6615  ORF Transcript_5758/g.6615 Transcript_5758/m.6615 type:complete len:402 (+) Transcript_5758:181-1386(+)
MTQDKENGVPGLNVRQLSVDQFEERFAEELALQTGRKQVTASKFTVGDEVEALAGASTTDTHSLFYAGTILQIQGNGNLEIKYEDDSVETDVDPETVMPNSRTDVYEDDELIVVDGHIRVCSQDMPARLMAFKSSPHLFQSSVLLDEAGKPSHTDLPFEQHQVLAFTLPLSQPEGDVSRLCLVGAGGGTLPMTLQSTFPGKVSMDVVDSSAVVIKAATDYFGLQEGPQLKVHTADGIKFLEQAAPGSFDILIVDAADSDAPNNPDSDPDGLEVPPAAFVEKDFFTGPLKKALTSKGVFCMNILAGRRRLVRLAMLFEEVFESVYILATDPNYFFYGFMEKKDWSPEQVVEAVIAMDGLEAITIDAVTQVKKTKEHVADKTLLGWLDVAQFVSLCEDDKVIV